MKKLSYIIEVTWPNSAINFTKKSLQQRVEEEIFILDKYRSYFSDALLFIDVGANVGMSALAFYIFSLGKGEMIAIEPLSSCSEILTNLSKAIPKMTYMQCGAGAENSLVTLNIGKNSATSQASSFLEFTEKYRGKFDYADVSQRELSVPIKTLNEIICINNVKSKKTILHIDVEGYEYCVLRGASELLPFIDIVVVEIGLELFQGQATASDIVSLLSNTHELIGTLGAPMMKDGEILVQDYLFVSKNNE